MLVPRSTEYLNDFGSQHLRTRKMTIFLSLTLLFGFDRPHVESLLDLAPSASFNKKKHGLHPLAESCYILTSSHHTDIYESHMCQHFHTYLIYT